MAKVDKVDKVVSLYKDSHKYYKTFRDKWTNYYKKYRGILDVDTMNDYFRWRSKLFIPATGAAVDGLLPDLTLTLLGSYPKFFQTKPREPRDVEQARILQPLMEYSFEEAQFFMNFEDFLKQLIMYGVSFGKVFWKKVTKKVKRRRPKMFLGFEVPGQFEVTEMNEVVFDGPVFEPIDIFNIYVSPTAMSIKDTWVIQRSEKTIGELKQLEKDGIYENIGDLEDFITNENNDDDRKGLTGLPDAWGKEDGDNRIVEILEYHNRARTKIITIAGRTKEIRNKDNKLYIDPFVAASLYKLPFELYSVGVPEKASALQDQLNSEVNQRLDNRNLKSQMIVKVRRGANVNVNNLISKPGAVWLTDDMAAIEPIIIPDVASPTSFAEENLLKREIEEITGVTQYAKGAGAGGSKTATEATILTRAGTKGFALFVMQIEEQAMKPIINKFYQLIEMLMEDDKIVRIAGEKGTEFKRISPEDIRGNYDFITAATSQLTDKNMRAQHMIMLLQGASQDPTFTPALRREMYKKMWELWGYQDFDELYPAPVQMPMMPGQGTPQGMAQALSTGGQPVEPTGMRMGTPAEGGGMIPLGGGGERPF